MGLQDVFKMVRLKSIFNYMYEVYASFGATHRNSFFFDEWYFDDSFFKNMCLNRKIEIYK